jgi:3-deoxy-D-manno-octulosonate 8-phosphate phosphatase (KDO 8-P phosphatase)
LHYQPWFDKKTLLLERKTEEKMNDLQGILSQITTFIFDFDGVMTDGTVFCDFEGHPLRATNVKDGYALQLASKLGYHVAVISGAVCPSTIVRMNSLGVTDVFTGIPDKVVKLDEYMKENGLKPDEIVFMGDDIPDLRVMQRVGLPACPADAVPEVKAISKFVSECPGGKGAVRDVIERVLKVQGKWMTAEAYAW